MKNIVFSTTRQWNPGDEFILFGILNLLRELDIDFNPIIFNRNPEIRQNGKKNNFLRKFQYDFLKKPKYNNLYQQIENFVRVGQWDNSFKDHHNYAFIDLIVFAGSPEWATDRCKPLHQFILKNQIPTLFIGIGKAGNLDAHSFHHEVLGTLNRSLLTIVRDPFLNHLFWTMSILNTLMPCPALFACPMNQERKIDSVKKIGLGFSSNRTVTYQAINPTIEAYTFALYKKLISQYSDLDFSFVCHYIDEIEHCKAAFPGHKVHYSYDAKDYLNIYSNFDMVVTPRIHGSGISSSLGIPSICIGHDERIDTCEGFLAKTITHNTPLETALEAFDDLIKNAQVTNASLIDHKKETLKTYLSLLQKNVLDVLSW